jgi:membrane protein DedA with SNARE-associated domain
MEGIFQQLLALVVLYGYPVVGGAEFLSAAGAPLPMSAILLLSGSLAALGSLNVVVLFLVVAATSVAGDFLLFAVGRRFGPPALDQIVRLPFVSTAAVDQAQGYFSRWAGAGIFLSRWLFTPVGAIVSLLAGVTSYPLRSFLALDVAGEVLAAGLWLGAGYAFGANWQQILSYVGGIPGEATVVALGVALVALALRRLLRRGS